MKMSFGSSGILLRAICILIAVMTIIFALGAVSCSDKKDDPASSSGKATEASAPEGTSGETEEGHVHAFGAWEPCDSDTHERRCACGEHEEGNHNMGEPVVTPAGKCTDGKTVTACVDCGYSITEVIHAEHNWGEPVVITEATKWSEGLQKYTCKSCHATKEEIIPKVVNEGEIDLPWDFN